MFLPCRCAINSFGFRIAAAALCRGAEARTFLAAAVAEIDELESTGALPVGFEPETRGERTKMRSMMSQAIPADVRLEGPEWAP